MNRSIRSTIKSIIRVGLFHAPVYFAAISYFKSKNSYLVAASSPLENGFAIAALTATAYAGSYACERLFERRPRTVAVMACAGFLAGAAAGTSVAEGTLLMAKKIPSLISRPEPPRPDLLLNNNLAYKITGVALGG